MRVVSVQCPHCGARLQVEATQNHSSCEYCGTTSRIQPRTGVFELPMRLPPLPPGQPNLPVAKQVHSKVWYFVVALPVVIALSGAGLGYYIYKRVRNQIESSMGGLAGAIGTRSHASGQRFTWQGMGPALLMDVNGDGERDPIGRLRYVGSRDAITLGAFDGASGEQLWESEAIGTYSDTYRRPLVLVDKTLLIGDELGKLLAFSARTGETLWQVALGERSERVCAAEDGQVIVVTADRKRRALALASGEQSPGPVEGDCGELLSDEEGTGGAVERIEARRWRRRIQAEGMKVAYGLRRGEDSAVAVIGHRHPGTRVPMVGRYADGELAWQADLPAGNPMAAEEDLPTLATVSDDALVALYELRDDTLRLTSLALERGDRRWDVAVPQARTTTGVYRGIVCSDERVFISSWGRLDVFDLKSGEHLYHIGR